MLAFWAAERFRGRFHGRDGWRQGVARFLDAVHLIRELFAGPRHWWTAIAGMAVFWAGDAFAAWCGLAAFGLRLNGAAFIVGLATGMVFTRRAGPLAGAGILALILPLTLWGVARRWRSRSPASSSPTGCCPSGCRYQSRWPCCPRSGP